MLRGAERRLRLEPWGRSEDHIVPPRTVSSVTQPRGFGILGAVPDRGYSPIASDTFLAIMRIDLVGESRASRSKVLASFPIITR